MDNYILTTTTYTGYTTYGIAYIEYDITRPILVETYPDLNSDKERVLKFVDECNECLGSLHELADAVEAFLG